jgi:hypothetical protein
LQGIGTLPDVRVTTDRAVRQGVDQQDDIFQSVERNPNASTRRVGKILDIPQARV